MSLRAKFLLWGQSRIEKGSAVFAPLSFAWAMGTFLKNLCYDQSLFTPYKVSIPVISIGNLVAGGTGKTPLTALFAALFAHRHVAILSRSYGDHVDEPLLLKRRAPHAKVYVGKDRRRLAKRAEKEGAEVIFIDDGFQYRKLHRDLDLVLLEGSDPFGKGHFLPWGFLRDSPARLKQADAIFVSGDTNKPLSFPHIQLKLQVDSLRSFEEKMIEIPEKRVAIFCGIAKPHRFRKTVQDLGYHIVTELFLADHEKPSWKTLQALIDQAKERGAHAILCTEKDYVKWMDDPRVSQQKIPFCFVEISMHVAEGEDLWQKLIAKIEQKIDNSISYGP